MRWVLHTPKRLIAFVAAVFLGGCQSSDPNMAKYKWLATDNAPYGYPAYIVSAFFKLTNDGIEGIPDDRISYQGWGETGALQIIGNDLKAIPAELYVVWFDLISRKGYEGKFKMPTELIRSYFKSGLPLPSGKSELPHFIRVGFAPGGVVGVWVSAESVKHSVGIFQAHEKKIELSQMSNDPNEDLDTFVNKMIDASLSHPKNVDMRGKPVPEGLWRDLDIRYDWHFSIQGISPDLVWVKSFNGNNDWFDFSGKRKHPTSRRDERAHLPETIDIHWTDASKNKYWAQAEMDLEETKAAFETLSKESPQEKMELVLHEKGALLKTKSRTITLSKFKRNTWKN